MRQDPAALIGGEEDRDAPKTPLSGALLKHRA